MYFEPGWPLDISRRPFYECGGRRAEGEGQMNSRFNENVADNQLGRVAYATNAGAMFKSLPDVEWAEDTEFHTGDAILADPTLKGVFREAILNGWAEAKGKS